VPDPVFASGAMGSGVAVDPSAGKVFAPFDGKVVAVLPSKHAVGLISDDGVEVLIHIGIDTVQLKGEHFTCHVDAGQLVSKGDLLIEFDINAIQNAGYSVVTPVIVTNSKKYSDVLPAPATVVKAGEELLAAVTLASAEEEKVSN
ncbi:MAG: PTS sugar transporter subunit IIA, partial [Brooklawnia sp.]